MCNNTHSSIMIDVCKEHARDGKVVHNGSSSSAVDPNRNKEKKFSSYRCGSWSTWGEEKTERRRSWIFNHCNFDVNELPSASSERWQFQESSRRQTQRKVIKSLHLPERYNHRIENESNRESNFFLRDSGENLRLHISLGEYHQVVL